MPMAGIGSFPCYRSWSHNEANLLRHVYGLRAEAVDRIRLCTSGKKVFLEEIMDADFLAGVHCGEWRNGRERKVDCWYVLPFWLA